MNDRQLSAARARGLVADPAEERNRQAEESRFAARLHIEGAWSREGYDESLSSEKQKLETADLLRLDGEALWPRDEAP